MSISCGDAESGESQFHGQLLEASLKFWRQKEQKDSVVEKNELRNAIGKIQSFKSVVKQL
jgi:hypothetical protein